MSNKQGAGPSRFEIVGPQEKEMLISDSVLRDMLIRAYWAGMLVAGQYTYEQKIRSISQKFFVSERTVRRAVEGRQKSDYTPDTITISVDGR